MSKDKVFKFVEECQPVKGCRRSIIYDLPRNRYDFIPNGLYDILVNYEGKTLKEIKKDFGDDRTIDEYFKFLLDNEYIFFCDKADFNLFPKIDFTWEYPAAITNAILFIDNWSEYDIVNTLFQLEKMGCKHILIVCNDNKDIDHFDSILGQIIDSSLLTIEIHTKFYSSLSIDNIKKVTEKHLRLRTFVFHSAPYNKSVLEKDQVSGIILFDADNFNFNEDPRGRIRSYFNVNIQLFAESQQYNVYYNRKIFVDTKGNIKNNANTEINFGNLKNTLLSEAIEKEGFKNLWNVHKDLIKHCKDCEFRYMCMDSRIPVRGKKGEWQHITECFYNPYIAKWKGESGYRTIEKLEWKQ